MQRQFFGGEPKHNHRPHFHPKERGGRGRKKRSKNGCQSTIVSPPSSQSCQQVSSTNPRSVLPERKADPDTPSKLFFLFLHLLYIPLLLFHLGVFGHVLRTRKIVIVSSVNFRVKSWDKRCPNRAEVVPWSGFEEGMGGQLGEGRITNTGMCN